MERLTYRTELGVSIDKNKDCPTCSACWNCNIPPRKCGYISDALKKLAEYEHLEKQGRLIKLPCKEAYTKSGDIVYLIYDDEVVECTHCGLGINPVDGKAYIALATDEDIFPYRRPIPECDLDPTDWCTNTIDAEVGEIGKTVFLTKSEAEAKLKELRGGKNEERS